MIKMSDEISYKIPYIGNGVTGEILERARRELGHKETLLGTFIFEIKHVLVLTSKYFINWNRSPILGRYNRTEYSKISGIKKSAGKLLIRIKNSWYTYNKFDQSEIDTIKQTIIEGTKGFQHLDTTEFRNYSLTTDPVMISQPTSKIQSQRIGNVITEDPIQILKRRYASGEISKDEYVQIYADLTNSLSPQITCGGCGSYNLAESEFCIDCGVKLGMNNIIDSEPTSKDSKDYKS